MRIDAQCSLWRSPTPSLRAHADFPGEDRPFLPEHLLPILARNRFDRALLKVPDADPALFVQTVEWCRAYAPLAGLLIPFRGAAATSEMVRAGYPLVRGAWVAGGADQSLAEAAAFCAEQGVVLDVAPPFGNAENLALVLLAAQRFPELPVVLAHCGDPPSDPAVRARWQDALRSASTADNMYCKLGGMWSSPLDAWPLAEKQTLFAFLLDIFGPQRLLFASDWPFCLPAHSWKACLAAFTQSLGAQPMEVREEILGYTAMRVYRISE